MGAGSECWPAQRDVELGLGWACTHMALCLLACSLASAGRTSVCGLEVWPRAFQAGAVEKAGNKGGKGAAWRTWDKVLQR